MDCSLRGFSVHRISQTKILEWVAIFFSRGFFWPRDKTCVSWIGRWILYHWATNLPMKMPFIYQWKGSPFIPFSSVQFSSVAQLCLTLGNPTDCSIPGFPVHHQLLELTQTHVHWTWQWCHPTISSSVIQPSHPLSSPSPSTSNLSRHQGLFKWDSFFPHQVAKVLEFQLQPSVLPMNIQDWLPLGWTGWISWQSNGLSRVFSNSMVQKHQFFGAQLSL